MQPIVPSSLMNVSPASRASRSGGILLVGVAQRLELRMAGQRRVVEGDLGVEADEPLHRRAVGARLADDGQRVDLDEVRVVGEHRPDEALGDPDGGLEVAAQAHREREVAGLEVEQAQDRVRVAADDRLGMVSTATCLDLDAALGRAHQQDPAGGAVEDRRQVELLDDVRGRRHEDLAHGDALDVHPEDGRRDALRLVRAERRASRRRPCRDRRRGPGP